MGGARASETHNLAVTHPDLAAQWHPTKNGDLTPADVVAGTHTRLWWKCPKGPDHEWQAPGNNRINGSGCPACAGRQVSVTNSLANYPELAAQFHPTKNGDLTPADVVAGTNRRLWWKCPQGPDHEWEATGGNRVSGSGCPACAGRQVSVTNSLANYPELAAQFNPTKNGDLTPADVVAGTNRRLWWKCPEGPDHEWEATGGNRVSGSGCPFCAGFQVSVTNSLANFPELAAQFHPTKNGDLTPAHVTAGTHTRLWWKCPEGPDHEWVATGNGRVGRRRGCPYCAGYQVSVTNTLANFPELAAQFHPTKNGDLNPSDVVAGTVKKLWWKCPKGPDHEWQTTGNRRVYRSGCPFCAGFQVSVTNSLANFPELAAQFHPTKNGDLTPADVVAGTHTRLWWKCPEGPDHEWQAPGNNRLAGNGCPRCAKHGFDSSARGWLYLLDHPSWGLTQIGITNDPKSRLSQHEKGGWNLLDLRGPMDGNLAKAWETSILKALHDRGIQPDGSTDGGKFDGYTESWPRDALPVTTLRELMDLVEDNESVEADFAAAEDART
ncbi:MAG: zinc-ribbon domain-containing protein [Acidimicrobiales bacterium]